MKFPKRFSLSALLLLMLFASLIFGYAQWRKQWILRRGQQLEAQGATILIGDDWFYPVVSSVGSLHVDKSADGTFAVGKDKLSEPDAKSRLRGTAAGMHEIGVETIAIYIVVRLSDGKSEIVTATEQWLEK